jgi:undecaprenyl pyrophosphate synthase
MWKEDFPELYEYARQRLNVDECPTAAECVERMPKIHLGIIPDGNRRWMKKNDKTIESYAKMIETYLFSILEKSREDVPFIHFYLVGEVSFYVLSKDNLAKRDDGTLKFIEMAMDIMCSLMRVESVRNRVKIDVVGDVASLPIVIRQQILFCERMSKGAFPIHLAIGYDPIEDSVSYLKDGTASRTQMDMVFRSGGELRSSGFFPLQTLYSEWVYSNTLWPDMTATLLNDALNQFLKRKRNFGK